jgi:hypothetical protein
VRRDPRICAWIGKPRISAGAAIRVNNLFNKQLRRVSPNSNGGQGAFTLGTPYANVTAPRFIGVELNACLSCARIIISHDR